LLRIFLGKIDFVIKQAIIFFNLIGLYVINYYLRKPSYQKNNEMRVVMLGSGNAATVLCKLIKNAGHEIVQIVSRNEEHTKTLATLYQGTTASINTPEFASADIYIMALHDAALDNIESIPALKNKFVVHTSGAVSISALKDCTKTYGVLYPMQTLSKLSDHIPKIPFLIDGNNQETRHRVLGFAKSLSDIVIESDDNQRLNYHVAAVFVSNFTNHLYALTESFCKKERLDFANLLPLIDEINLRVHTISPAQSQTGPAIRNDIFILNKHLQALSATPEMKYIYLKLTESIIKFYGIR
jgi:predicted short-subunit dehydrogenase-like oxidoreductase (DUF2520 family)